MVRFNSEGIIMSARDAVAQGRIKYNLDDDTLEAIQGPFEKWAPVDFSNLSEEDINFLKMTYSSDLIDRIIIASKEPK